MSSEAVDQKLLEVRLEVQDAHKGLPQGYKGKEVRVRPVAMPGIFILTCASGVWPKALLFWDAKGSTLWILGKFASLLVGFLAVLVGAILPLPFLLVGVTHPVVT